MFIFITILYPGGTLKKLVKSQKISMLKKKNLYRTLYIRMISNCRYHSLQIIFNDLLIRQHFPLGLFILANA